MPTTYTSALTIPTLTTATSFIYKGTALSTTLNNYLLQTGGDLSGNLRVGGILSTGDATYQLLITAPTSTTPASIQTIQQGSWYSQRLIIQGEGDSFLGIGTNGAYNSYGQLDIGGDNNNMYYTWLSKLRVCGNDPNIFGQTSTTCPDIILTTANGTATIKHSIGNSAIKTITRSTGFQVNGITPSTGNVGIGITNPFASLCIGTPASTSDGTQVISRNSGGNRNF